jgi:sugar lactone lactonase YvrE
MTGRAEIAIDGLKFPEGPRWHDGALWLSDQLGGGIHRVDAAGGVTTVATVERPSGLGFLSDGSLLAATMANCRVVRVSPAGEVTEQVDLSAHGAHLNDMFVDDLGRMYVDAYGEDWNAGDLLLVDGGEVRVAAGGLAFPNGVTTTPDGATLLIAETFAAQITAFDVAPDGGLSGRRVWASIPDKAPDGLCLDAEGAVWVASYLQGEFLRVREGGEITDTLTSPPGRWAMACALGGDDGRTLYLCSAETDQRGYFEGRAVGHLETVRVEVPGVGRP